MDKKLIAALFLSLLISTVLINVFLRTQIHETITNTTFTKSNYVLFTATAVETHAEGKEPTKIPEQEKDDENV